MRSLWSYRTALSGERTDPQGFFEMCGGLLQDDVYDINGLLESLVVQRRKFFEKPH
jgi:hypothetical protein